MSLKDFKNMSVTQLKKYLQNRGVSVSGCLKLALKEMANEQNDASFKSKF